MIVAAVLPPFFTRHYAAGLEPARATVVYATLVVVGVLLSAVSAPVLGVMADVRRAKKKLLAAFTLTGCVAIVLLFFTPEGQWPLAGLWVTVAAVSFGGAMVFYDGLLPSVARGDEMDRVSTAGYALGYLGGGLLLALNTAWLLWPHLFGMADRVAATRWSILSVALGWAGFTVPLLLRVRERDVHQPPRADCGGPLVRTALARLAATFHEVRGYRDLFVFLVAFWFYNDGIGTIIKMATVFGAEMGIEMSHLVRALLLTQFVAFPFALLFGQLGHRFGPRNGIYLALSVYLVISLLGYFMQEAWHFYVLAALVGCVQGGAQGLSRSLFARMVPAGRAGEFFGFYSVSAKFATLFGPLVFAVVAHVTGTSRVAVPCIAVFFAAGMLLLRSVDLERGEQRARAQEPP